MSSKKVERAAQLLDAELRVHFSSFRALVCIRTMDIRALDAVVSLAGGDAVRCYPGTPAVWRCAKEGTILQLLQKCVPFMHEQEELAEAVIEFLEADTAEGMFNAMMEVWTLRRSGKGRGSRGGDTW